MPKSQGFHRFLFVFFRLLLVPLLIYGIFIEDLNRVFTKMTAFVPVMVAAPVYYLSSFTSLFPDALKGAGVPLIFIVGRDIAYIVIVVLCLFIKTPEIKALGLGRASGGAYWKRGVIPYWFLAAYVASAYFITQYILDQKAEFYTGKFSVATPAVGGEVFDPGYIKIENPSGKDSRIVFHIGNHLCFFSVKDSDVDYNPGDSAYTFPAYISSMNGKLLVKLTERDPASRECASVQMAFIDAHSAFMKFGDGVAYRIDRHPDTGSSYRSVAEKRYEGFLKAAR